MKILDESNINFPNSNHTNLSPSKRQSSIKITQKCSGGNTLHSFCMSPLCKNKNNFVCHDDQCECFQSHLYCIKGNIKIVLKAIDEKLNFNNVGLKQKITSIFTSLIDKISMFEEDLLKKFDQNFKFNRLIDQEKKFLQIFVDQKIENFQDFDGQKLQSLWKIIDKNNKKNKNNEEDLKFQKYLEKIQNYQKQSEKFIEITRKQLNELVKIKELKIQNNSITLHTLNSSIIQSQEQIQNLIKFFDKKVKSINLMYKASANNFEMKKYFQTCGHLQNTIALIQTQNSKIIGGYTPLSFNPINNKTQYATDQSMTSFIFSLSNNDKFKLKNKTSAIFRYENKQNINFGCNQLFIGGKANITTTNVANINNNYYCEKYKADKQSYLKFNGNQTANFRIKEWEIFVVKFQ